METEGALGALKALERIQEQKIAGLRDDQKQKIFNVLVSEIQGAISLDNKIESEEDSARKDIQATNATDLTVMQYNGTDVTLYINSIQILRKT